MTIKTPSFELAVYQRGSADAEKFALVLPGRLDTKDYPHMRSHVDYLADKGYLALSFDPPGTWESPGDIVLYTMTNYLKAIDELIVHFGNKPTLVLGHSRGGSVAMVAGTRNDLISHIVAVMSSTSPSLIGEGDLQGGVEITKRDMSDGTGQKIFNLPLHYFEDASQYNPLEALKTCTKPKLFIKGTKDTVIDAEEIDEAYAASAEPKMYREVDSDHDYRKSPAIINQVNDIVGDFLTNH